MSTITSRSCSASVATTVTVIQTARSIVLEPQKAMLTAIGETVQLAAAVLDLNEHPVAGAAVSWTSSDTGVATVDEEGMVTAVGNGSAGNSASYGDISAMARIEVEIADPDDRDALIALYNALDGPNWTHSTNWLSDLPLGAWHGVETDEDGSVTKLDLGFNDLSGRIPPELGILTNLQELDFRENAQLSCLTTLELGNLEELNLGNTGLSGSIPPALGNLSNLQALNLSANLLSGSIPAELGNLSNMRELRLALNGPSGSIPPAQGSLADLRWLDLSYNALSGSVPPELGNLSELTDLELVFNGDLSGPLPGTFTRLDKLQSLFLFSTGLCVPPDAAFQAWMERTKAIQEVVYCEAM